MEEREHEQAPGKPDEDDGGVHERQDPGLDDGDGQQGEESSGDEQSEA